VVNKITLPDSTTATQIGWDYNNDGSKDNVLGSILGALSTMAGDMPIQESVDEGVFKGSTLLLFRLQASDFVNEAAAKAQAWVGEGQTCCTTIDDVATCKTEAEQTCFNGSHTFYPDPASPDDALFNGKITAGEMLFGPAKMRFVLPFSDIDLELDLKAVYITGTMGSDGKSITDGVLAGAISQEELDSKLLPSVATMLDDTLNDPDGNQSTKDTIKTLFDTDDNGSISLEEVKGNSIISTFLAGDVDVDNDGVMELSLGVGFDAISAVIDDQGTPPDAGPQPDQGAPDAGPSPDTGVTPDAATTE
jgi:hypothetical protein